MPLSLLTPDWPAPARVRALITTRAGGVSAPPYAALNLGTHVGDEPAAVAENRRRLAEHLPAKPVWLDQVHGVSVHHADSRLGFDPAAVGASGPSCLDSESAGPTKPGAPNRCGPGRSAPGSGAPRPAGSGSPDVAAVPRAVPPAADAAVTRTPGRVLAVLTADCLPVLFCDRAGSVAAVAHAGWRGLAAGVLEATVAATEVPPATLLAHLGPAIGPTAFEVGAEVRAAFLAHDPAAAGAFVPNGPGKWLADLYSLARLRLAAAGVSAVSGGGLCTYRDSERFYSYRRDGRTGRMAALVWLVPGS